MEDDPIDVQPSTVVRAGAVSGFLYTAVIIATTLYVETQPLPPTKSTLTSQQNDRLLLGWVHAHPSLMDVYLISAVAGFVLLGCVAFAIFTVLRRPGVRTPLVGAAVALLGLSLSVVAAVLERINYVHYAQQYADAHAPSTLDAIVKSFDSVANRDYGFDTSGRFAVVFWIGIVGLSLMSIYGWRSAPVLGSFATFLVGLVGFTPVFALWSAGAGFGLWRVAAAGIAEAAPRNYRSETVTDYVHADTGRFSRRRPRPSEPIEAEAVTVEEVEPEAESQLQVSNPSLTNSRPPRGTSIPRQLPGHAVGSKTARPRKRR